MTNSCTSYSSKKIIINGSTHHKKTKYLCKTCGRQFIENSQKKVILSATKSLIDRLLLEKISLAGIAGALNISYTWLQNYVNNKYESTPRNIEVSEKKKEN